MYNGRTKDDWQQLWRRVCEMAYLRRNICEDLSVYPYDEVQEEVPEEYTLDYMWTEYNEKYHEALVVPELKKLFVPRDLFLCLGVTQWFMFSFPNCVVEFW